MLRTKFSLGTEEGIRELIGEGVESLRDERHSFAFRYLSAGHFVEFFRTYYGPTVKVFEALDEEGREALEGDIIDLVHRFNRSGDETMVAPSDYLEVVAIKR